MRLQNWLASKVAMLRARHFAVSVSKLIGGTLGAQLIGVAALPILTRIYSPGDFKTLAVYAAIVSILSVVACLRFDFAIPLPRSDFRAANLLVVSLLIVGIVCLTSIPLVALWAWAGVSLYGGGPWVWLIPAGVALTGIYSAAQLWASRNGWYGTIARTRITQITGGVLAQVLVGLFVKSSLGLVIGHALSGGIGGLSLLRRAWSESAALIRRVNVGSLRATIRRYRSFPKYSVLDGLSTNAASQVPILLIAAWSAGPEAGYLLLATKVVAAPVQMVSAAVSQVFLATAPTRLREGTLAPFTASIIRNLFLTMVVPFSIFAVVAIPVTGWVFGDEWMRAGQIMVWLVPWYAVRLLSSPISMVMNVVGRQRQMMYMKFGALLFRVGAVVVGHYLFGGFIVESLAVASFLVYCIFGITFLGAAGVSPKLLLTGMRS